MAEIMQGSTQECFKAFVDSYRENGGKIVNLKRELSRITGATESSVEDWVYNNYFPTGDRLLFLRFFLEGEGYHISELEAMQTEAKALARLINDAILSSQVMIEELGYKDTYDFNRILHGKTRLLGKRLDGARKLLESYHINYVGCEEFKEAKDVLWCLENYISKCDIKKDAARNISKELKIPEGTVSGWVYGAFKPIGLNLVMLKYFLEEHGYRVRELEKLAPEVHLLGRAITKRFISLEQAAGKLEYNSYDSLLNVLQGRGGISRRRKDKLVELLNELEMPPRSLPQANIREIPIKDVSKNLSIASFSKEGKDEQTGSEVSNGRQNNREIVHILTALLKSCMPLVELVASDKFTQEDRMNLRRLVGADDLFKLSNNLYQLNNERTRNMIKGGDKNAE